jgi:hypothetical protein
MLNGAYHLLDLVPKGRDEANLPYSMEWLRDHDRYEDQPVHVLGDFEETACSRVTAPRLLALVNLQGRLSSAPAHQHLKRGRPLQALCRLLGTASGVPGSGSLSARRCAVTSTKELTQLGDSHGLNRYFQKTHETPMTMPSHNQGLVASRPPGTRLVSGASIRP